MTKTARIVIGFAAGLILIASGVVIGFFWQSAQPVNNPSSPIVEKKAEAPTSPPRATINGKHYMVSAPSRGRAYAGRPLSLDNLSGSQGFAFLPAAEAEDIHAGQNILLYDKDGQLLEAAGKILSVEAGHGNFSSYVNIGYTLNNLPTGERPEATRGNIVTEQVDQVLRLPLSALRYDENRKPYLWEAVRQTGTATNKIMRRPLSGTRILNDEFFIMDRPDYVSGIYILDPDDALADGQSINVTEMLYAPGPVPDAAQIASAPPRLYDRLGPAEDPLAGLTGGSGCTAACGASGVDAFIAQVKALGEQSKKGGAMESPAP